MISIIHPDYYLFKSQYLSSLFSLRAGKPQKQKHTHILCSNKEELNWDTDSSRAHTTLLPECITCKQHQAITAVCVSERAAPQQDSLVVQRVVWCRMSACLWSGPDVVRRLTAHLPWKTTEKTRGNIIAQKFEKIRSSQLHFILLTMCVCELHSSDNVVLEKIDTFALILADFIIFWPQHETIVLFWNSTEDM